MGKPIRILTLIILSVVATAAQEFEYGQPEELKGLTKLYIGTGSDIKNRNQIINEINKAQVGIVVVDTYAEAEMIMSFQGEKQTVVTGVNTQPATSSVPVAISTPRYGQRITGAGDVAIRGKGGRLRYVLSFEGEKRWTNMPSERFAKTFLKAYKKANGLK